jgi:hypothetical protein
VTKKCYNSAMERGPYDNRHPGGLPTILSGRLPVALVAVAALATAKPAIFPATAVADQQCIDIPYGAPVCYDIPTDQPPTETAPAPTPTPEPSPQPEQNNDPAPAPENAPEQPKSPQSNTTSTKHKRTHHTAHKNQSNTRRGSVVVYNQNQKTAKGFKWGNRIASTGCGPASIAIVMATLKQNRKITPLTVSRLITPKYYAFGSGTAPGAFAAVAKHYGVKEKHAKDLSDVKRVVQLGGLSIVHAKPGHFTQAGHYMAVVGVTHNGKFKLSDPNSAPGRDSEKRYWTASELRKAGIDDAWNFENSYR